MQKMKHWFENLPLTRKLSWLVLLVVGLALALVMAAVTAYEIHAMRQDAAHRFGALADVVARECTAAVSFDNANDARHSLGALREDPDVTAAWVVLNDRRVFAEFQRAPELARPLPPPLAGGSLMHYSDRHLMIERAVMLDGERLGWVVLDCSLETYYRRLAGYAAVLIVVMGLAIAATLWFSRPLQRQITGPLHELSSVAREVARHKNYGLRAAPRSRDEVGQLVQAFNQMLQEVQVRDAELEHSRATLEQRVQERTAELQHEIAERRQIEEELRQSERRFAQIFRACPMPIVLRTQEEGRILEVNDCFLELFGYTREEVIGRTVAELGLNPNAGQMEQINRELAQQGHLREVEIGWRGKAGRNGTARLFVEKIEWIKAPCLLVLLYDTTRQTTMERQLRQAMKMEAVGQLAAGVAHDFNNLLTIIQGNTSLGLSEPDLTDAVREYFEQITQAAERAGVLTRQMLAFSRQQVMRSRALDLNQVIVVFASMLHRAVTEKVKLTFNLGPETPPIFADSTMVEQVLTNLCLNARDAMPQGGELIVATEEIELSEEFVRQQPRARAGRFVRMQVSDNGVGMSPELLQRIFDPFFTTKEVGKGTGLGLAAVYGIVETHQGWIDVESELGAGSTFSIFWPVAPASAVSGPPAAPRAEVLGGSETILLVEDEPAVRGIARHVLKRYGYTVVEAVSGRAALKLWPAVAGKARLVISDVVMPDGISGRQLAEELRRDNPELPIILVSGYSAELGGADAHALDGCKFLAKPFKPVELARLVREMLDGHAQGGTTHFRDRRQTSLTPGRR